uniref:Sodium- and chloride-dependent GABA transporter 2-like n=2 Tax=Callorhinchus milii TaxID=7868 RepID=A0A4W3GJ54_CALMI
IEMTEMQLGDVVCGGTNLSEDPGTQRKEKKKEINKRGQWDNKFEFLLSVGGSMIGFDAIFMFPGLCFRYGGAMFLIPYFIFVLILGIPLFLLETALGQYSGQGTITAWQKMCPMFEGIGYSSLVSIIYLNIYNIMFIAWLIFYLCNSFVSVMPWADCNNEWNTENCTNNDSQQWSSSEVEFWANRVLKVSSGIEKIGTINWTLALSLLAAWTICYFCIWKGIKTISKVVYVTATFPYVMLIIILIRSVLLPGAADGIKYYLYPQWSSLFYPHVWFEAGRHVIFSFGLALCSLKAMSSYNHWNNNCYRDCLALCFLSSGSNFVAGFAVFSILGFVSHAENVPIHELEVMGQGLMFITFPKAVSRMPLSQLWWCLFVFMCIFLAFNVQFVSMESLVTTIVDVFPRIFQKGFCRELFILAITIVFFLISLLMVTEGGLYIFYLIQYYGCNSSCLFFVAIFETIGIAWIYGADRFYDDIANMIGYRPWPLIKWCWCFYTPSILIACFIYGMITDSRLTIGSYVYPTMAYFWGWLLKVSSLICIPLWIMINIGSTSGSLIQVSYLIYWKKASSKLCQWCTNVTSTVKALSR